VGYIAHLLTNFQLPKVLAQSHDWEYSTDWPIWKAAQATSAAKTFFPAVVHDNTTFIDGAFAANNPSVIAMRLGLILC